MWLMFDKRGAESRVRVLHPIRYEESKKQKYCKTRKESPKAKMITATMPTPSNDFWRSQSEKRHRQTIDCSTRAIKYQLALCAVGIVFVNCMRILIWSVYRATYVYALRNLVNGQLLPLFGFLRFVFVAFVALSNFVIVSGRQRYRRTHIYRFANKLYSKRLGYIDRWISLWSGFKAFFANLHRPGKVELANSNWNPTVYIK